MIPGLVICIYAAIGLGVALSASVMDPSSLAWWKRAIVNCTIVAAWPYFLFHLKEVRRWQSS